MLSEIDVSWKWFRTLKISLANVCDPQRSSLAEVILSRSRIKDSYIVHEDRMISYSRLTRWSPITIQVLNLSVLSWSAGNQKAARKDLCRERHVFFSLILNVFHFKRRLISSIITLLISGNVARGSAGPNTFVVDTVRDEFSAFKLIEFRAWKREVKKHPELSIRST